MANPLDTLLQKVRSNVTNTASRLFGQAQSFVQQNPTPAGFIGSRVQQPIQNTFNTLGNQFNTGAQNFLKPSIVSPLPDTKLQKTLDIGRNIIGQTGKQIIQEVPKIGASALRASPSIQLDQQIQGLNPSLQKSITNTRIFDAYNLLKGYGLATSGLIGNAVGGLAGMGMNTVNNALQGKPLSQNYAESFGKGVVDNAVFGPINKLAGGVVSQVGKLPIKPVQRAMNIIKSLEEPIVKYGGMYPEQTSLQIAKRALGAGVKGSIEGVIYGSSRPLQNGETRQEAIKNDVLTFTAMSMITQGGKDITRERLKPLAQKIGIGFKDYWNYLKGDGWTELPNGKLRFDESLLASSTKLPEGKVDVTKGRLTPAQKEWMSQNPTVQNPDGTPFIPKTVEELAKDYKSPEEFISAMKSMKDNPVEIMKEFYQKYNIKSSQDVESALKKVWSETNVANGRLSDVELVAKLSPKQKELFSKGTPQEQQRALENLRLKHDIESNPNNFGIQGEPNVAQPPLTDIPSTGGEIGGVPLKMETLASGVKLPEGKVRGFTQSVQEAPMVSKGVKAQVKSGYIPKKNDKLMGEAQALLQEGASIDLKNTQNIDQKITATMQEALNQQRKNPQLAANLYNNLAEKGTELGRGVQAFSLLNKMSPDAIALSAAGKIKAYNRTAVRKIPELTGDQVKLISKQVDVIKKLAEGSRERNIAVNNLSNTINDFIPSSFADKAIAVWKAGLLTSLRTSERNIFGNSVHGMVEAVKDLPASLADRLMAGVTGKRTLTPTFQGAGEMYSKKTGQQISDVLRLGYDASEDISKFDHKRITWANTPVQQALKKYTDIVFRSLGAQDKPFYNSAFKRSLYSQAGAEAINIGQEGNRAVIQKLVESPTDEMIKTAISDANVATFKDKNSASSIANAIKREMAKVKLGDVEVGKIVSEVFMPFTGVPTSILGQIANYSPIGLLKGIINTGKVLAQDVPELQRQAAHEIGRGVIGTGIFGLGSYLASKGLITGQPKDATEQRQWDLENKPRNSILINGKWRSLNSVGPEAVVFLAGAKLNEEMKNPEGSIGGYAGTLGKDYLDQSFVTGIQQPVNAITDPARYGKSYVGNQMASVMPNIGKDLAKSLDPLQREANTVTDYVKQATPLLRNTLIEKRDTLGNVMPQEPTGLGAFFDLFNSKTPVDNAVVNELSRLSQTGNDATPSKLTPNQTILKQKVKLTFEQLNQLEKGVGEALKPRLESLVTSPNYQQLDDEQKAQAIDKIVQETRKQYKNLNASSITSGASPTTLPQGEMIPIVNKNGNVTMIDTSFQPERPKLTGQAELDKKLLSSYYGDITQKTNDIVALYKAGKLSANDANTQIAQLKALKGGGSKKVSLGKMRMPKLKKLKVYKMKKIKFKKIKLPKLSKLKATRV